MRRGARLSALDRARVEQAFARLGARPFWHGFDDAPGLVEAGLAALVELLRGNA